MGLRSLYMIIGDSNLVGKLGKCWIKDASFKIREKLMRSTALLSKNIEQMFFGLSFFGLGGFPLTVLLSMISRPA